MFKVSKTCCSLGSLQLEFLQSDYHQAIPLKCRGVYKLWAQTEALADFQRI